MYILNPSVDFAFKKIFGTEENKDLLISFINAVLSEEDQAVEISLLNPYSLLDVRGSKGFIFDIRAKDVKNRYFKIEIQFRDEGDYDECALQEWAKLYGDRTDDSKDCFISRKTIAIHIHYFLCILNNKNYANKFSLAGKSSTQPYVQDLVIYTIELDKFVGKASGDINLILPRIKNSLDRWVAFLTNGPHLDRNNLPKELIDDLYIKKALDVLNTLHLNKEEDEIYENHLKWLRIVTSAIKKAKARGWEEGLAEAKREGKAKEMARNLLKLGIASTAISEACGLSEEEIRSL